MNWTIERISDLSGKVIIVTGGNSGLGYESVKAFAMKGADVVLASRSTEKGEEAKAMPYGGSRFVIVRSSQNMYSPGRSSR